MATNYLIYPCKTMKITQNYLGKTSHYPHTVGYPRDYPIDEGCADTGRDWLYCPCDKMKIKRIYGVGNRGVNTLWLESTSKVLFADGTTDYFSMLITHPEDADLRRLKVGQTFTRGQQICREGKDGATGNHFHISGGKGKLTGNGWTANTRGKYVLTTTNGAYKPEQLFWVDTAFTKILSKGGITFKTKGTTVSSKGYSTGNYKVTADLLNVRKGAGTAYAKIKFKDMTDSAQEKIKQLNKGKPADGFVKGLTFTALQVKGDWGKCPTGWVNLKYCKKI